MNECVKTYGYCVIVVSEGIRNNEGQFLSDAGLRDAFGHAQLGGVAPVIAQLIKAELGYKYHWAVADYLQRAARHIASQVMWIKPMHWARLLWNMPLQGHNAIMPIIIREQDEPYQWSIGQVSLADVANQEKAMPAEYITEDGMGITDACRRYLSPLIQGEAYPAYINGLPDYVRLKNRLVAKNLRKTGENRFVQYTHLY